jgi:hypothetical protein
LADPLSPHCCLPNFWTSDFNPHVRPQAVKPYRIGIPPFESTRRVPLSVEQSTPSSRPRFLQIFPYLPPIDPWQGIGWENAPPTLQNGLRSILPLIFFSAPRPMLFAPTYQTKKLRRNSKCVSCLLHHHPICSRFATERAHCFHDATCQILPPLLRRSTTGSRIMRSRAAV